MKFNLKNKIDSNISFLTNVFKIWILTSITMGIAVMIMNLVEQDIRTIQGFTILILLIFIFSFPVIVILTFIVKYIKNRFFANIRDYELLYDNFFNI